MIIISYTYYSAPWRKTSGDDVRVHEILKALSRESDMVVAFTLISSKHPTVVATDPKLVYMGIPRFFYIMLSALLNWRKHYDLNPLEKFTHYIDELYLCIVLKRFINILRRKRLNDVVLYIFGSMSLAAFFLRKILRLDRDMRIVYDALGNYAQTLYLRSRRNFLELIWYGLYLALHKLQLKGSDVIVYPSKLDKENAEKIFNLRKTTVISNPFPICYESTKEYLKYRNIKSNDDRVYFILLAGRKSKGNEEVVRKTIKIFNELDPRIFKLVITGPWTELQDLVRCSSIDIRGVVPHEELKKLLAVADAGLVPVFSHIAGTYLKTLAYLAADLDIIGSPWTFVSLDSRWFKTRRIILVHSWNELKHKLLEYLQIFHIREERSPVLCEAVRDYYSCIKRRLSLQ